MLAALADWVMSLYGSGVVRDHWRRNLIALLAVAAIVGFALWVL